MGLFSFIKEKGAKIFGKKEQEAPAEEKKTLQAQALLDYVKELGLPYNRLKLSVTDDDVKVEGEVASQEDAEKIVLAIGNVEGVDKVDNLMIVMLPAMEAKFYTVFSVDIFSKIFKDF